MGLVDGGDLYGYVRANPIVKIDSSGFQEKDVVGEKIDLVLDCTPAYEFTVEHPTGEIEHISVPRICSDENGLIDKTQRDDSNQNNKELGSLSEDQNLVEQFNNLFRKSKMLQLSIGAIMGGIAGAAPGGFGIGIGGEVTDLSKKYPREFRIGYGAGEALWGLAQIIAGAGGSVAGGAMSLASAGLTASGVGALPGLLGMGAGAGTVSVSTAAVAEGAADLGTGIKILLNAVNSPSGGGSKPPFGSFKAGERVGPPYSTAAAKNVRFTADMNSRAKPIALPGDIDKIEEIKSLFGGRTKDWSKMKTWDSAGREIHYYSGPNGMKVGIKFAGELDPF